MSGHSKWSTIKRKKGAADAARGKIFTRLAREIQVAARDSADVEANFALRLAVERARAENMPKENIERAIRRGSGQDKDGAELETVIYEGYGPHGIAILVECYTDNRNRTIADVRRCFTRGGGSLGEPNSVAWQFTSKGYIVYDRELENGEAKGFDSEELFMAALEAGAEDVVTGTDSIEVYTEHSDLAGVAAGLARSGFKPDEMSLIMRPNLTLELPTEAATAVLNVIENLEELDDVSRVYHNLEISEDLVAHLA